MTKRKHTLENNYPQELKDKFLSRISKYELPLDEDQCWHWEGAKAFYNYGVLAHEKSAYRTHRISYELFIDVIPDGLDILHKCDNPSCFRPTHLFAGSKADNMFDMYNKGRDKHPHSQEHFKSKLTNRQVQKIRQLYESKQLNQYQLAAKFGVAQPQISRLVRKLQYRDIVNNKPVAIDSIKSVDHRVENSTTYPLAIRQEARDLYKNGMKLCDIARKLDINIKSIWFIVKGRKKVAKDA